jgi:Cu(I)/Ag(I) efflux system protein CusF
MKKLSLMILLLSSLWSGIVPAQTGSVGAVSQATSASSMADGEVRKVDKDAAKITLRHGELKNLEMPAMTMVFQVKDKAMLDQVKVGDKVRFTADKVGGVFTITHFELVK